MSNVLYIYEMFSGGLDTQIIQDVISAFNGDTNKAVEHLLEIAPSQNTPGSTFVPQNQGYFAHTQPITRQVVPTIILSDFIPQFFPSSYPLVRPHQLNLPRINQNPPHLSNGYYHHRLTNTHQSFEQSTGMKSEFNDKRNLEKNTESNHSTIMSQKDAIGIVKQYIMKNEKILVILRGCPGSGKTTLARQIKFNGVILSTDDYFSSNGVYSHSLANLSKAHEWNQEQAQQAMKINKNPVIIDNTNIQKWEMIPYAALAHKFGYAIEVVEPDVQWRQKAGILAKKNIHGVKKEKIVSMLNRYDNNINGCDLLKMVKGESGNSKTNEEGVVTNQEVSDSKINKYANSLPPPHPPDDSNWKNMKYGDRSGDINLEKETNTPDSFPERNLKDEGTWDGECATLREWMSWGEENKSTPSENGSESSNCYDGYPFFTEDYSVGQLKDIGNADLDVIKLEDNFVHDACFGNSSGAASLQSEKSFEDDNLSSRASSVDKQDEKASDLVEKLSDELEVVMICQNNKAIGTDDEELNIVEMFERTGYPDVLENFQAIITPRKESVVFKSSLPSTPSRRPLRYGLDKSAQTLDDFLDDCQMLVLLECCFPDIDPDEIKKLYSEKKNDPKALVDILTDVGKYNCVDSSDKEESDGEIQSPIIEAEDQTGSDEADQGTQESNSSFKGFPPLLISAELGDQLLKFFGKPQNFNAENDGRGYTIDMSVELAQMIHQTWTSKCTEDKLKINSNKEISDCNICEVNSDHRDPPVVAHNSLSTKIKLKQLYEKFPSINKKILDNIFGASGYMLDVAVKTIQNSPELTAPVEISMTDEYAAELEQLNITKAIEASLEMVKDNKKSNNDDEDSLNAAHSKIMKKMNFSHIMFKEFVGKAKDAFSLKKFPQAHYYSIKAREWKQKYFEEKHICAKLLLKKTTECSLLTGTIDLHGLKVKEAIDLVSEILTINGPELSKKRSHLFVITGRGNHSAGGVARIKPCLESYLRRNKFFFSEATPGIIKVNLGRR